MAEVENLSNVESGAPSQNDIADSANKKKNANSYYYWHGHEKERAKVGDVAPMPVPVLLKKEEAAATSAATHTSSFPITKHSWCDGKKAVTVYIDTKFEEKEAMVPGTLQVDYKKRRLEVSYVANVQTSKDVVVQRKKHLALSLSNAINDKESSHKVKDSSEQIVIRLVKAKEMSWWELVRKDGKSAGDSDSDNESNADEDGAAQPTS
uniref:Uncharacterized protein TCIL3000_11_15560 n=1 Tax=Trypanosoma congolense (strain IL3000) TaxID=1068625 RepID=G0V323_TRYCI|nr:unnamed protein product [Trypanosoma congolense IL3000]